ncbi:MAG: pyridoxal-phosphate dependent enzyme, partial [Myxococcota bacterium]|nr:pyridoxal-phosphate dependent enzyme [Myxococcota bacterium]
MSGSGTEVTCAGCGRVVDAATALPFACPDATPGDGIDHLLAVPGPVAEDWSPDPGSENPFVRYRRRTLAYRVARAHGLADAAYVALVEGLDAAITQVDGGGFRRTPLSAAPQVLDGVELWWKDETGNVSGSHKARHLMGVMIYLKVLEALDLPLARGLSERPLAIASCGNAALGAAVVARAARWPLDVFIPPDASPAVVARLEALEARVHVCPRTDDTPGDPCVHAFRAAVRAGSLPFGVQGNDNGLAVEGGKTLGYELVEQLAGQGTRLSSLFVQVGGGALGSGCIQALREARAVGTISALPALFTVQTFGAYPLAEAHAAFAATPGTLQARRQHAVTHRGAFMRPWPTAPHSVAHGILDDETYDWVELVVAMSETGGQAVVATE